MDLDRRVSTGDLKFLFAEKPPGMDTNHPFLSQLQVRGPLARCGSDGGRYQDALGRASG